MLVCCTEIVSWLCLLDVVVFGFGDCFGCLTCFVYLLKFK